MTYTELMIKDLQDLFQAESEQASQLPQLASQASNDQLRSALQDHAMETQQQVTRLRQILEMIGETPGRSWRSHSRRPRPRRRGAQERRASI